MKKKNHIEKLLDQYQQSQASQKNKDTNETNKSDTKAKPISFKDFLPTQENTNKTNNINGNSYNALELYNLDIKDIPKLLAPFLQKVGLASLVGTSDTGKSTFLRQLAIAIALQQDKFLNFPLKCKSHKVIYVSTEDDPESVGHTVKKQVNFQKKESKDVELELLKNLDFIFDTDNLLKVLEKRLNDQRRDLIIIDTFADVFNGEINANTQVRSFLNGYDKLAKKHKCLILFLHHTGKRTTAKHPDKDNVIGSQAFEAKMRVVMELRPGKTESLKELWVLKGNFLKSEYKKQSYTLECSDMIFSNTGKRGSSRSNTKSEDDQIVEKVIQLRKEGLSYRKIEEKLSQDGTPVGRSTVGTIVNKNKNRSK